MEDLAKLFQIGDQEHKGFLIRRDMQRLQGELSLSADQLEAVFDSLDSESQGYLTLDKFLLGYSKHRTGSKNLNANEEAAICEKDVLIPNEIGALINDISSYMFLSKSSSDHLKEISQIISDGQLLSLWEQLLSSLNDDMKRTQEHMCQLENLMNARETQHKTNVRKLFEDMETQLREEKDKVLEEEARKFNAYREHMANELEKKAEDVKHLSEQNSKLESKLSRAVSEEQKYKMLVKQAACDQRVYASQVENLQKSTLDLQNELESMKAEAMAKNQEEYARGFRTAQLKSNFEEDSFIQQLKMLRSMQNILSPEHVDQIATSYRVNNQSTT